ncbi:hypothetical protein MKX01_032406 [Papaver californicum]|nr:hypothetical protein MKX01_032406 [Papaver californicum]
MEHFYCDFVQLIFHKTKLCAAALAPFKAYKDSNRTIRIGTILLDNPRNFWGVPKQSQAQHEMINMQKLRICLQQYYGLAMGTEASLLQRGLKLLPTLSTVLSLLLSELGYHSYNKGFVNNIYSSLLGFYACKFANMSCNLMADVLVKTGRILWQVSLG